MTVADLFKSSLGPISSRPPPQIEPGPKATPALKSTGTEPAEDSRYVNERRRKRRRKSYDAEDATERSYEDRLAQELAAQRSSRRQRQGSQDRALSLYQVAPLKGSSQSANETTRGGAKSDRATARRTIFIGNVPIAAVTSKTGKRSLMKHLSSHGLEEGSEGQQHIDSIRFRSIPLGNTRLTKRSAVLKGDLWESTSKSAHAYVLMSSEAAAEGAAKRLNGSLFLDRHLRVDNVGSPAKQDHRRCLFIGNVGFVDSDDNMSDAAKPESAAAIDYEEGLWRAFSRVGKVDSVRIIRDSTSRVGKGFAYVQFADTNSVEKGLALDGKSFPPMVPRRLRVRRAKKPTTTNLPSKKSRKT